MLDLMRLPLGVLSGIGFIGAGAIVPRDNFVVGVTTAATIWYLTLGIELRCTSARPAESNEGTAQSSALLAWPDISREAWTPRAR
jgi:putative Mg2+ transporter-C (MgtC) family protein